MSCFFPSVGQTLGSGSLQLWSCSFHSCDNLGDLQHSPPPPPKALCGASPQLKGALLEFRVAHVLDPSLLGTSDMLKSSEKSSDKGHLFPLVSCFQFQYSHFSSFFFFFLVLWASFGSCQGLLLVLCPRIIPDGV